MTLTLLIDACIQGVGIGLAPSSDLSKLQWTSFETNVSDSSRRLALMVQAGLSHFDAGFPDLDCVCVNRGPGSFTGIRVGLSYAQGLAAGIRFSHGRPLKLVGVEGLGLLAKHRSKTISRSVCLFLPATKTNGFFALSRNGHDVSFGNVKLGTNIRESVLGSNEKKSGDVFFSVVGSWSELQNELNLSDYIVKQVAIQESLELMLAHSCTLDSKLQAVEPLYLRKSSVEELNPHGLMRKGS